MSKPDALLPCPFCGAAGMVGETLDSAWYAMCEVDACVEYGTHWLTQAEAIAAWNRRAGQSHTDGLVAALEMVNRIAPLLRLITIRQVIEAGEDAMAACGLNPWCINEGLATGDEPAVSELRLDTIRAALTAAKGQQQ